MATEFKEFDCETCPFCNCVLDMHKDFYYDPSLRHASYLFKCHDCGTVYEVVPVISSWRARAFERGGVSFSRQNT